MSAAELGRAADAEAEAQAVKARMGRTWSSGAQGYHKWMVEHQLWPGLNAAIVQELQPLLAGRPDAAVLDVASASGEPAASLAAALPRARVVATDLAAPFVELGRRRAARLGLRNLTFEAADAERLAQFAGASFDAVTCSLSLMMLPDYPAALREFWRVLRPGGALALTAWLPAERVPFFALLRQLASELDPSQPAAPSPYNATRFGDPSELLAALGAAGFCAVRCRQLDLDCRLPAGAWWETLREMPLPFKAALEKALAVAGGPEGAQRVADRAQRRAQQLLAESGWLRRDGSFVCPGNGCWLITARRPTAA